MPIIDPIKPYAPPDRERILALLSGEQNRTLLVSLLANRYSIATAVDDAQMQLSEGPFDLCMIDAQSLARHQAWLRMLRRNLEPLYLPVVMLAEKSETARLPQSLWQIVDDVLLRPVDRIELVTRVQSLLRTRALSVRAHRMFNMYEQESRIARRLQATGVPNAFPTVPNVFFDGFYRPSDVDAKLGGDWYDVLRLADGRIVISIGDVAGSGIDAAITMGKLRQVVRAVAQLHADPAFVLRATEQALQTDEPGRYVTAFVGVLDAVEGRFDYASAGHPMPIMKQPDGSFAALAEADVLLGTGMRVERSTHSVVCRPGSTLVLFTDGLTEATHDVIDGQTRIEAAVRDLRFGEGTQDAGELFARMIPHEANDDTAILVVTCAQHPTDPALTEFIVDSSDVGRVRDIQRAVVADLAARHYGTDTIAACELSLMELVGNAVRYAPGEIRIVLDTSNSAAVLHVLDRGRGFTFVRSGLVDQSRESGRGLFIIAALAEMFTVNRRIDGGSHARVVLPFRSL